MGLGKKIAKFVVVETAKNIADFTKPPTLAARGGTQRLHRGTCRCSSCEAIRGR